VGLARAVGVDGGQAGPIFNVLKSDVWSFHHLPTPRGQHDSSTPSHPGRSPRLRSGLTTNRRPSRRCRWL